MEVHLGIYGRSEIFWSRHSGNNMWRFNLPKEWENIKTNWKRSFKRLRLFSFWIFHQDMLKIKYPSLVSKILFVITRMSSGTMRFPSVLFFPQTGTAIPVSDSLTKQLQNYANYAAFPLSSKELHPINLFLWSGKWRKNPFKFRNMLLHNKWTVIVIEEKYQAHPNQVQQRKEKLMECVSEIFQFKGDQNVSKPYSKTTWLRKRLSAKTLMQIFLDSLPLAKEKSCSIIMIFQTKRKYDNSSDAHIQDLWFVVRISS